MTKKPGIIFIILTALLLHHSFCLAGARSTQTIKSPAATGTIPSAPPTATTPSTESIPSPGTTPGTPATQLKTNLVVDGGIAYSPVKDGMVTPGKNMHLGFNIKNAGLKASGNSGTYSIQCTVLSGGECPVTSVSNKPVPNLAPGASKSYTLIQTNAAENGKYRVIITTKPSSARGRPKQIEFTVGNLVLKNPKVTSSPGARGTNLKQKTPKHSETSMQGGQVMPGSAEGIIIIEGKPGKQSETGVQGGQVMPGSAEGIIIIEGKPGK